MLSNLKVRTKHLTNSYTILIYSTFPDAAVITVVMTTGNVPLVDDFYFDEFVHFILQFKQEQGL